MNPYISTLVVRTRHTVAAVELNGAPVGDVSPDRHIAVPLSESGDYYIGIFPLTDDGRRFYPVVRKLRFQNGALLPALSGDVEAYAWPGGIYEAVFSPGVFPAPEETVFPFTVDQLTLPDGCIATLYYENGLRIAIEEGKRLRCGAMLGREHTGKLQLLQDGMLCIVAGKPNLPGGELPGKYGTTLLVLDKEYHEALRIFGNAAGMENETAVLFTRLPTLLRHERRQAYRYRDGTFHADEPVLGFFTHTPRQLTEEREVMYAFCEAVRYQLWEEAFSYLSPELAAGLTPETIRACMGEFADLRAPYANEDRMIGLCYPQNEGAMQVRVFTFSFTKGKIDNIMED